MYWVSVITEAGIFAILALGLDVIWGWGGDFDLAFYGYLALGSYMMKSFASFLTTLRGATFRCLDRIWPYRQTDVQLAIDKQKRFPAFHQLTAKPACNL